MIDDDVPPWFTFEGRNRVRLLLITLRTVEIISYQESLRVKSAVYRESVGIYGK